MVHLLWVGRGGPTRLGAEADREGADPGPAGAASLTALP